ncbi:primary-amine oxidase [Emericellopsis cladophorae]|uniref:Amine oxidase n=1 Tax=Emericellopsis cladophorae TaxID=2686198 RepID=A0A9P9Y9L6_9HYPO|nr:primary-amine oxidase [Emericellopsis cladophorae]KAI6785943.1 primary-amine oxidase [Emericellopsis cladophorae]
MSPTAHPLDPVSPQELSTATHVVRTAHASIAPLQFQAISLLEPRKAELSAWLVDRSRAPRPARVADVTVIAAEGKAYDGFVDLKSGKITKWEQLDGLQPIITLEELQNVEEICRQDLRVIERCRINDIPASDMHKVYCDLWIIGHDERYGNATRRDIVLNDLRLVDKGVERPIFYRMSLAEMVVPYGNPEHPHQRKHAFDLGGYGAVHLTNSFALGRDCKGTIHYLDADFARHDGGVRHIKNDICLHEEAAGILFKHTDFQDDSTIVTRARKLVVQQIFTAANYEYAIQSIFHQDGTIQPESKLTGILNTYVMAENEDTHDWGTQVYPGVNAHNHQHLFCLRVHANIDGPHNTVFVSDTVASDAPVGSPANKYGNAFYARQTKLATEGEARTDYDGVTSRTLVSREVPGLLPKAGSLVWERAGFARHAVHVTKYRDDELWPAGRHVPQTDGEPSSGLPAWIGDGATSIDNTDIVLWHTFGVTHIPLPEDFPIMPAETMTLLLRPRNFFASSPAMNVRPSYCSTPEPGRPGE